MPALLSHPGVYIEEIPSGVRTITGVATSITAFVGRAWRGPVDKPTTIFSYADYGRIFGGPWRDSTMSYAVQQFFANGGSQAVIVRVATRAGGSGTEATPATIDLGGGNELEAASPGTWGRNLVATVDHNTKDADLPLAEQDDNLFNLTLFDDPDDPDDAASRGGSGARETFLNVSRDTASPRFVGKVLEQQSTLARVVGVGATRPAATETAADPTSGGDGDPVGAAEVVDSPNDTDKTGMYALLDTDLFNLLCIPPYAPDTADNGMATWTPAAQFCKERRAFLLVDAPQDWSVDDAVAGIGAFSAIERANAALYFPRLRLPDPLQDNRLEEFAPCGAVAGVMSRTDAQRGVWKAPAGIEANLQGVLGLNINGLAAKLTDGENGRLNPLGINCLRGLPNIGHVVWGARTLAGNDALASEWKYVPVRRLALFLEETLFRGTQWVVFEPNDEPLWAQIRLNVGAFMHSLFLEGAFQGSTPRDAYYVRCNRETTTQADIDKGVVNIEVGFAPLKPAEFVVIKLQQMAQQAQV
jgi:phage tail sheath protein FI